MRWDAEIETLLSQTEGEVFEKTTLDSLWHLMNDGVISSFDFPISTGKEGTVFRAFRNKDFVAVKIYRINTATFRSISKHLMYNPPKNMRKDRRSIILSWAFKEFNNLQKLFETGIRVPKPIARYGNVIVMEYIGTKNKPAPLLKDAVIKNIEPVYHMIRDDLRCMYQRASLIHADFSAFNVLMHKNRPIIIDVGQSVSREHPMALTFLRRDTTNIVRFFNKYIKVDEEELYQYVMRCENEIC